MIPFNKHKLLLTVCCFVAFYMVRAQETGTPVNGYQSTIVRDQKVDILLDSAKAKNLADPTIKGYRIQLYMGTERKGALEVKSELQKSFPELQAYIIYQQPYFKVRIGDYRNQAEAQPDYYLLQASGKFSKAFIVPDAINLPKLD